MNTMKHTLTVTIALLAGLLLVGCGQNAGILIRPVPVNQSLRETVILADSGWSVRDKIVIVDVDGLLLNEAEKTFFGAGENPVSLFVEKLDRAQADPDVRAVVVRINSPGGGVTASDIMYNRLLQFRQHKRVPVVAIIQDVGASGGYYIACGADTIMAHPTAVTGSIGVIVQLVSFADLMEKLGIDAQAVTSGRFKSMGSPLKPLEKEDMAIVQGMVNDFYERFVAVVQTGRPKLTPDAVRTLADGRVYTGQQAKANGMIDDLGYMMDAIVEAKTRAGSTRAKVVIYHRPMGHKPNAYATTPVPTAAMQFNMVNVSMPTLLEASRPQFLYLWSGHTPKE